jgi:anti-anti-sigma regulatory factor
MTAPGEQEHCPRCTLLEQEVTHLREAMASRDLIGQAKGIIMGTTGGTAAQAFEVLRTESQHTNRKLRRVAADLVACADRGAAASALVHGAEEVMRSELRLDLRRDGAHTVVVVDGDLDSTTARLLDQALAQVTGDPLVVDLAELGFADLRGLRPLLRIAATGREVQLRNTPRFVSRLLAMRHVPATVVVDVGERCAPAPPIHRPTPRPTAAPHASS